MQETDKPAALCAAFSHNFEEVKYIFEETYMRHFETDIFINALEMCLKHFIKIVVVIYSKLLTILRGKIVK